EHERDAAAGAERPPHGGERRRGRQPARRAPPQRRKGHDEVRMRSESAPIGEGLHLSKNVFCSRSESHGVGMKDLRVGIEDRQLRAEVLRGARRGAEVPGVVRPDEHREHGHRPESWVRIQSMSKGRSEDEQKAVETILWALGHKLHRLKDEYAMKTLRG